MQLVKWFKHVKTKRVKDQSRCLCCRYMADEARSLKAYQELPENSKELSCCYFWGSLLHMRKDFPRIRAHLLCGAVRVNETDTFADEDGANDEYFDFEDISGETPSKRIRGSKH